MTETDPWALGGMYDTSTVTFADRARCFATGHDATYGTLYGWCKRCKHTVWTRDRKSVLYYGKYHRFPPAHVARRPVVTRPTVLRPTGGFRAGQATPPRPTEPPR